ncbi:MAG: hypothetical protein ACRCZ9_13040 [Fusobacteriaceae bacterium]
MESNISSEAWMGFLGSIIGSILGIIGIWWQIKASKKEKIQNIKNYILEIIDFNLKKIEENLELKVLHSLNFETNTVLLGEDSTYKILDFETNENLEMKSLVIELSLGLEIRELNSDIKLFNDLLHKIERANYEDDFFHNLKIKDSKFELIKKLSFDISNWVHFLMVNREFPLLEESREYLNKLINLSPQEIKDYYLNDEIILNLKMYAERKIQIDNEFIKILYRILSKNLSALGDNFLNKKHIKRYSNIHIKIDDKEEEMSIFFRKKAFEIEYMIESVFNLSKKLKNLKESKGLKTTL